MSDSQPHDPSRPDELRPNEQQQGPGKQIATTATGAAQTARTPSAAAPAPQDGEGSGHPLVVVGIGGSAGALDGYERFFLNLPPDSGVAFVVVPHLDPRQRGLMPEILQRCTDMPVVQIEDGMTVQPNRVHVIAPGHSLSIMNGMLLLEDLELAQGRVIDRFFESLASDQGENAVGIILSGMGSDGTRGIQAIREQFGLTLVQDPHSAEYPAMPRSAAATQMANAVLPAEDLARHLYSFVTRARTPSPGDFDGDDGWASAPLHKILRLVRVRTGHDFTRYKRSTLVRRIDRRMKGHRIEDITEYIRLLDSKEEADALFRDFTINVTSFFRDVDAFDELKDQMRRLIRTTKQDLDSVRVWVAGCSTGEEAYSVAMVLHELTEELRDERTFKVQLFATDIDREAVDHARYGLYSADISYVVPPDRLERHFQPQQGGYQVRPEIRNMVVFATHNTFGDPPFTRLDLLCCRNMLIYLNAELQAQIMSVFHYALRPGGLLFLGASETAGTERERFTPLSSLWKIYRRGDGAPTPLTLDHPLSAGGPRRTERADGLFSGPPSSSRPGTLSQQAQAALLTHYAPPSVVVDASGDILMVNGPTGQYLELPLGRTLTNVFEMARDGLRYELPAAVRQALEEQGEVVRTHLQVEGGDRPHLIDLIVRPLPGPQLHLLIVFRERPDVGHTGPLPGKTDQMQLLERELQRSRENLQAKIEDMAVSVEELRSTNEELQTSNEELQSSNEELTTSKEELQSLNEELITINAEHQRVISELGQANNDMKNLLDSAGIATVFLGNDLTIQRFTPRITRVINLMAVDLGRPITDISVNLRYEHLTRDIKRVLDTLETLELQVQTHDGQWYLMRISPYRTSDNFIDGVVVAFTNVDVIKAMERQLRDSLTYADGVLNSMQDPLLVLDAQERVVAANRALYSLLQTTAPQLRGEALQNVAHGAFDQPDLRARLRDVMTSERPLSSYVIDLTLPQLGTRKMKTEADPIFSEDGHSALLLFKMEDVTALLRRAVQEGEDLRG